MGMLREYDDFDKLDRDALRSSPRDEYLTQAYIDGRNAARDGKPRTDITGLYACDSLAGVNWEVGYDDWTAEQSDSEWQLLKGTNK